jgi:hypothetical protein
MVDDDVGGAVSGSRVYFQIWKVSKKENLSMSNERNSRKIRKKSEKKTEIA